MDQEKARPGTRPEARRARGHKVNRKTDRPQTTNSLFQAEDFKQLGRLLGACMRLCWMTFKLDGRILPTLFRPLEEQRRVLYRLLWDAGLDELSFGLFLKDADRIERHQRHLDLLKSVPLTASLGPGVFRSTSSKTHQRTLSAKCGNA